MAKPLIRDRALSPWCDHISSLAQCPNVMCKVSGLVTEANWQTWQAGDFKPFLDVAFEAFGPDRLMFGSDWPVVLLAASHDQAFKLVREYVIRLGEGTEAKVFGLNATRFYDL